MSSLFDDTHNVVAILEKSDAAEGFEQIIDFLSGSYIHYALIVNPHIYISCIKQFWNTASVKRSADVTRLQALVDKKKIVISEAIIREILQLDDAEGVVCLSNEEIFAGLAQIGYEKPSTKLTFYKAYISSQWKFFIHTLLQSLSAMRTSWNEFSMSMASAVICLSKGQKFNFSKYIFNSLIRNVDSSSKFYMYPRFIQLIIQNQVGDLSTHSTRYISPALTQKVFANMKRVGKGFSRVETPFFAGMLVAENVTEDIANEAIPSPPSHDIPSPSQEQTTPPQQPHISPPAPPQGEDFPKLEIVKLKARVKRLEKANKVKSSKLRRLRKVGASRRVESSDDMEDVLNQGRMIADLDIDEGIELVKDADIAETEERHAAAEQADKQAKIYNLDLDHPLKVLSICCCLYKKEKRSDNQRSEEELSLKTPAETHGLKDKGKGILVESPKPIKKKDQIELDAEYARKLHEEINKDHEEINKDIDWDAAMDHTESEARKNMMIYLKNTAGYKMDFFKGMSYADICLIFQARFDENMRFLSKSREEIEEEDQKIIKSINETPAQKAAKSRKFNEEAQEAEDLRNS
uniref:Synaptobrevin, longin-like domain protein n=1 Tax=Tanacetum cinerariifolium TaxID=118510 RepID=A0A6L2M374_TANCI|nr:hypothetical protein [Tanacetum cinerariifolium]